MLECLYRAWCHDPVALLSLNMLSQNYEQCSRLIKSLYPFAYMTFLVPDQLLWCPDCEYYINTTISSNIVIIVVYAIAKIKYDQSFEVS